MIVGLEAIEDALRGWVIAATGIPAERVTWSRQDGPRPPGLELAASLSLDPLGAPAEDFPQARLQALAGVALAYSISAGSLLCAAHGRSTGDGPFEVTGAAAAAQRWLIRISADRLALAASFQDAMAGVAASIPGAGSGQVLSRADTTPMARPVVRAVRGQRILRFSVELRGGPATGSGRGALVLDHLMSSLALDENKARLAAGGCAAGLLGAVDAAPPELIARTTQQQLAAWSCEIHCTAEISERVGRIETFQSPTLTVI